MKDEILEWLKSGAEFQQGVRLFLEVSNNHYLKRIVAVRAQACRKVIFNTLVKAGDVQDAALVESCRRFYEPGKRVKFREVWKFLSESDCPAELKILAADKITAYHKFNDAHARLFDCKSETECYEIAKIAVDSFIENDIITKEFRYYAEHRSVLGLHPIFREIRKFRQLKQLSVVALMQKYEALKHNIWRIESEIRKKDKPQLNDLRNERLQAKRRELECVGKLLEQYR